MILFQVWTYSSHERINSPNYIYSELIWFEHELLFKMGIHLTIFYQSHVCLFVCFFFPSVFTYIIFPYERGPCGDGHSGYVGLDVGRNLLDFLKLADWFDRDEQLVHMSWAVVGSTDDKFWAGLGAKWEPRQGNWSQLSWFDQPIRLDLLVQIDMQFL